MSNKVQVRFSRDEQLWVWICPWAFGAEHQGVAILHLCAMKRAQQHYLWCHARPHAKIGAPNK